MQTSQVFDAIAANTLADSVADKLRVAIICGKLQPGQRLSEPEIAAQMDVSRGPVREALATLEHEGLVYGRTNRGSYVWTPTSEDVDEILSIRISIDVLATEWAMHKLTDEDFANLEALIEQQRQLIRGADPMLLLRQDARFHEYICRKAGHARLLFWWQEMLSQIMVLMYHQLSYHPEEVTPIVLGSHREILDCLRRRDLQGAQELHHTINHRFAARVKVALKAEQEQN